MYNFGIDLGGTKIEGVVLDSEGSILFRERIPTQRERGYAAIISNIKKMHEMMARACEGGSHSLGIGTPGAVSPRSGLMMNSNTECLNGKPFREDLQKTLGREFAMENDANCFALAEAQRGAACGLPMVFGVIMGTGCGGGIVYRGHTITGSRAIAGEWGHTVLDPHGHRCWCGKQGCIERYISGCAVQERFATLSAESLSLEDIVMRYREGDTTALRVMNSFFDAFALALSNVINILDPDIVVLGGGVSNIDELYTEGTRRVAQYIFGDSPNVKIVRNELGDSAGVIGAALLGAQRDPVMEIA